MGCREASPHNRSGQTADHRKWLWAVYGGMVCMHALDGSMELLLLSGFRCAFQTINVMIMMIIIYGSYAD